MLRALSQYFAGIPPVFIDGCTYVLIAFFGSVAAGLGGDDAAKYVRDDILFWLRLGCGSASAAMLALKMFRSTSYSDHQKTKDNQP